MMFLNFQPSYPKERILMPFLFAPPPQAAVLYYTIVERILGPQWLTPALFRIGASSLAGNLLNAIVGREENYF